MSRKDRGFTLVELMVTVAVLAVMAVIAVPALDAYLPRYRVDSASKAVMSEMQLARMRAVSKNRPHTVTFDDSNQSIVLAQVNDDNSTTTISTILFDKAGRTDATFEAVKLGRATGTGAPADSPTGDGDLYAAFGTSDAIMDPPVITFLSNGLTDVSGEFYLTPTSDLASGRTDRTRAVQIFRAGLVRRFKYNSGWEELK